MSLGEGGGSSNEMWISPELLPKSPGHPFYQKLNRILREARFDDYTAKLCSPYYAKRGRPSIPPGVYFRMILIGYFEGIESQRGIAWRCSDSNSLRSFLGLGLTESVPDHSSLTRIRQRLPLGVYEAVFQFVLEVARAKGLVKGKEILIDATTLEANAAMKSIVRKESGEQWKEYLRRLAKSEGIEEPSDSDLQRFDRNRPDKSCSNKDWESPSDPDSRIMKMKDGRTHLGYKAEHAVDGESGVVLAAEIYAGNTSDPESILDTLEATQMNLVSDGVEREMDKVVADKGYHKASTLAELEFGFGLETYIAEPKRRKRYKWALHSWQEEWSVKENRNRLRSRRGKRYQRLRSLLPERSFANLCRSGSGRRTWLRGRVEVSKQYLLRAAGYNLGIILRSLCGVGTPKGLQGRMVPFLCSLLTILGLHRGAQEGLGARFGFRRPWRRIFHLQLQVSC